ncbi:MAG: alpha/beta fold hydrolase [Nitrososphaeraceae archaeon]
MNRMVDRNVTINGSNIRYREFGESSMAPKHLLFLHGLGSSSDRWIDIPEAFSRRYHTVAVDLIGFGGSDAPHLNYTINAFRDFVVAFMSSIQIDDGKTTIIGHSLGGYIAAEIAIANTKMVESLVLIDSSGMLDRPTPLLDEYLEAAMSASHEKIKRVFEQLVAQSWRVFPILVDVFINRINRPGAKHAFESAFLNSTNTKIGLDRLKEIKDVPTLIIWGKNDNLIPFEHSSLFEQTIENSSLEIVEDAGHAPYAEKPAIVTEILHEFFKL